MVEVLLLFMLEHPSMQSWKVEGESPFGTIGARMRPHARTMGGEEYIEELYSRWWSHTSGMTLHCTHRETNHLGRR